jgi:hypothetical protein
MVVSEIKERLSPNMAPPTTDPRQIGAPNPELVEIATAIGVSKVIVPTEVPMETDTKHPMRKIPTTANFAGIRERPRYTVLSAPPAAHPASSAGAGTAQHPYCSHCTAKGQPPTP